MYKRFRKHTTFISPSLAEGKVNGLFPPLIVDDND